MNDIPLKNGDICIVVNGPYGIVDPNIGKIVKIEKRITCTDEEKHKTLGPVYLCIGKDLITDDEDNNITNTSRLELASKWLQRINATQLKKLINSCF